VCENSTSGRHVCYIIGRKVMQSRARACVCDQMVFAPHKLAAQTGPSNVLACGTGTTMVLNNEGDVWCTGLNYNLQLGFANAPKHCDKQHCWTCVKALSREYFQLLQDRHAPKIPLFRSLHTCGSTTFAVTPQQRLFSWGNNDRGQLAQGDAEETSLPGAVVFCMDALTREISNMPLIWQVACGNNHCLALSCDGVVMACGDNSRGQLGRSDVSLSERCNRFIVLHAPDNGLSPTKIHQRIRYIASGANTCAMVQEDRLLYMWGCNVNSQVPDASASEMLPQRTPLRVTADRDNSSAAAFLVDSMSIGYEHCACITTDNKVWTWGMNTYGKLANGTKNGSSCKPFCTSYPSKTTSTPIKVCCGGHHTLILTDAGSLWAAGSFKLGLGIDGGHDACACHFKQVVLPATPRKSGKGPTRVLAMAAGKTHSAIITTGNVVLTCGKMKSQMPTSSNIADTDAVLLSSPYCGFGGLGYFQGLAQQGHVNTFQKVHQLVNVIGFQHSLAVCTLAKVQVFLIGVYFHNQYDPRHTQDRRYMNKLPEEVLDLMILNLIV